MKVNIIKPQVDRFVFPVRHGVNVFATGRLLNFGLRPAGHHFFLTSCFFTKQVLAQIC